MEELLGLAAAGGHASVNAVHAEVAVDGAFNHIATTVATGALAVIGALLSRVASTAATAATITATLLAVALRRAAVHTLEGVVVTLLTPGTVATATTATVVTTLFGEAKDGALRLTASANALLVELTARPGKGKFEAERLRIPPIAGLMDTVNQFL